MDPFSIIVGATGLATFCYQVSGSLITFIGNTSNVDTNLTDLNNEITTLSSVLVSIANSLQQDPSIDVTLIHPDRELWGTVETLINHCKSTLKDLHNQITGVRKDSSFIPTAFRRVMKQVRLNMKHDDIIQFRRQLHSYYLGLQTVLQMINVGLLVRGQSSQEMVVGNLQELSSRIGNLEDLLHHRHIAAESLGNQQISRNLQRLSQAVRSFYSSASTVVGESVCSVNSVAEQPPHDVQYPRSVLGAGSIMGVPLNEERRRIIEQWISPPSEDETIEDANNPIASLLSANRSNDRPSFIVSAPGKVIVSGEHAVVHGKAAIAAAISLRSYIHVSFISKSCRSISVRFREISLYHTWDIDNLPWEIFQKPSKKKSYDDNVTSIDQELLDSLLPHVQAVSAMLPDNVRKIHHTVAHALLYLLLSLGTKDCLPCVYTIRSAIPFGAGLGSSASIAVCLSAALLHQIGALRCPHPDQGSDEASTQIDLINRWAFVGEMIVHRNPSGVDNTLAAGGKAVMYRRDDYSKPPLITPLGNFPELPLLLVDTCQPRSTAVEVAKVGASRTLGPAASESILDAINSVTESIYAHVSNPDFNSDDFDSLQRLGNLIIMNHGLLVSFGVSHPRIERVRELTGDGGIGWTKLTGAGGGGCTITILKPSSLAAEMSQALIDLKETLRAEGFMVYETKLAGDGVGILSPAVMQNKSSSKGFDKIDPEMLHRANGSEGIDMLLGIKARIGGKKNNASGEGWRFWRP
ncbi:ribosomal protein S5 domain 2-type protein [Aspergillus granulosus]|uniref:mevalonate kinase n=1 Tax=Aspergillus granulosus TaxID=176169 RepID=A0ABR4GV99_9EURO